MVVKISGGQSSRRLNEHRKENAATLRSRAFGGGWRRGENRGGKFGRTTGLVRYEEKEKMLCGKGHRGSSITRADTETGPGKKGGRGYDGAGVLEGTCNHFQN